MQAAVRSGKAKKVLVSGSGSKHTSKDLFWEACSLSDRVWFINRCYVT